MNEQDRAANYIRAFEQLLSLIHETDGAIGRADRSQDRLGIKQYTHLKKEYVQQLADLISRAPDSVEVKAIAH